MVTYTLHYLRDVHLPQFVHMNLWPSASQGPGSPERAETAIARLTEVRKALRPALFFCNAFGDHLCARPTVLALQAYFGGRLGFIGHPYMAEHFYPDADFRFVHEIPFVSRDDLTHGFELSDLRKVDDQFDALISLNPWDSPLVRELPDAIAPRPFIGLNFWYSDVSVLKADENIIDHTFKLAKLLNPQSSLDRFATLQPRAPLYVHRSRHIRDQLPTGKKVLCVHTETQAYKQWPLDKFRLLINTFLDRHDNYAVVVVDPTDNDLDVGPFSDRIFSFDQVDVDTATDVLAACDLFVGIDSYFMHVADFARVPTVAIFGETDPRLWGPRFAPHHICRAAKASEVSVQDVLVALEELALRSTEVSRASASLEEVD